MHPSKLLCENKNLPSHTNPSSCQSTSLSFAHTCFKTIESTLNFGKIAKIDPSYALHECKKRAFYDAFWHSHRFKSTISSRNLGNPFSPFSFLILIMLSQKFFKIPHDFRIYARFLHPTQCAQAPSLFTQIHKSRF